MNNRRTTAYIGKAKKIRFIAEKILSLPTLPTVVTKMMEVIDNPKTSAKSLAQLIEKDQVLTAKLLKLSNSAFYGYQRDVATVSLAIVVVGFDAVKDMGLSVSILDTFKDSTQNSYFDVTKFWEHAISVGMGARMLAKSYAPSQLNEAFTAGLMHDIGKVVVNQYLHEDFMEIMERVHEEDMDMLEAETLVLDATHDRIGGWLAEKWNMPYAIVDAIEFHHNPYLSKEYQNLAALVKLSDYLSRISGVGVSGNKKDPTLSEEDIDFYTSIKIDVSTDGLNILREKFILTIEKSHSFIDIIKGKSELDNLKGI